MAKEIEDFAAVPIVAGFGHALAFARTLCLAAFGPVTIYDFREFWHGEQGSRSLENRPSLIQDRGQERKTAQFLGTTGLPGALGGNPSAAGKIDFIGGDEVAG